MIQDFLDFPPAFFGSIWTFAFSFIGFILIVFLILKIWKNY